MHIHLFQQSRFKRNNNTLDHSPFAGSWLWGPVLTSTPPTPLCLSPLPMLFFLRPPFNQLKACPSELPGFLCPRWALASRAKISVMSRGTRSPVDLLRDIAEVLRAKPPARLTRPLMGTSYHRGSENSPSLSRVWWIPLSLLASLSVSIFPVFHHLGQQWDQQDERERGWDEEKMKKGYKGQRGQYGQSDMRKQEHNQEQRTSLKSKIK